MLINHIGLIFVTVFGLCARIIKAVSISSTTTSQALLIGQPFSVTWTTSTTTASGTLDVQLTANAPDWTTYAMLATGVSVTASPLTVTIPTNVTAGYYCIVLYVDSGSDQNYY